MSGEIETYGADAAAVFARQDAWHRLGTTLKDVFTAEEAMKIGHLGGWNVRKSPLWTPADGDLYDDDRDLLEVPDKFASVRTSPWTGETEVLGVVGNQYTPIQNEEHCELLNAIVDEGGAHFETAGSLKGGREVFVSMRLPKGLLVGGEDPVDLYLTALNSHDGSTAFRFLVTPIRVVCANTQAMALRNHKTSFSVRHTTNAKQSIQTARDTLQLTWEAIDEFEAEAEKMIQETISPRQYSDIIKILFPPATGQTVRSVNFQNERTNALNELFRSSDTARQISGTRWGAYNAVTEYLDHYSSRAGTAVKQAERALSNSATATKSKAFELFSVGA